jgi:hypothetical protein
MGAQPFGRTRLFSSSSLARFQPSNPRRSRRPAMFLRCLPQARRGIDCSVIAGELYSCRRSNTIRSS